MAIQNMKTPLVSIVAVCYNHKPFISDCILSLVKQSYPNTEIIVYDNGSTDGSALLLEELQVKYKFELIIQENIGLPKTLNKAVERAKGKYISLTSTDDYWPLDKIEIAVDFMENCDPQIAVCGGNAITIDREGIIFRKQTFNKYHELTFNDVFLEGKIIPALTSLIRKEVLTKVGGYDENQKGEDTPMWLKITYHGYRIAYLNKLMGYYRHHDKNITHQRDNIVEEIQMLYRDYLHHPDYEQALSNKFFRTFSRYLKIDKAYSIRFLKYVKIRYLTFKQVFNAVLFFLMPYGLIRRITRVI
jgi:alpha-1,3-rhamnosyltransferase